MEPVKILKIILPLLLLVVIFQFVSSEPESESGEYTFSNSIDLKDVEISETKIKMNAGSLNLTTHTLPAIALNADFTRESWRPEMKIDKGSGRLSLYQPDGKFDNMGDEDHNNWELKFPVHLNTNLKLNMGAGEGIIDLSDSKLKNIQIEAGAGSFNINLANTSLSRLDVNAGVGELNLDLSGRQKNDLDVSINGGVGAIKLTLPRHTGVKVRVNGIGGIEANELVKKDGYYVNDIYGKTSENIEVEISGGLGSVELSLK